MGKLSRRIFLGSGATLVVLGGGSFLGCAMRSGNDLAEFHRLDVLLADIIEAPRIGRAARSALGEFVLQQEARANAHITASLKIDCAATRRAHLQAGCRMDFTDGRIILCDRFVLSHTETIVAGLRYA